MNENNPWLELLTLQRWAALGTISDEGVPYVSSVAYTLISSTQPGLLMHLSQLAAHTGYLQKKPACSLLIAKPDDGTEDPQTLPRFTLVGTARRVDRDSGEFANAARCYIRRFPHSEMRFGLGDFHLFHFTPKKGIFVGGFGGLDDPTQPELWSESFALSENTFTNQVIDQLIAKAKATRSGKFRQSSLATLAKMYRNSENKTWSKSSEIANYLESCFQDKRVDKKAN